MTNIDKNRVLGRMLGMAGRSFKLRLDENLIKKGYELSAEHMIILIYLSENEGVNQNAIKHHMIRGKTAITRLIDTLESMKLVTRIPDKEDRRQNRVYLTKSGRMQISDFIKIAKLTERQAVKGIDPKHVAICKDVLIQIRNNLED